MNKFKLHIGTLVQGKFDLKALNIAFVFQVNCPGCFIYGFPTMNNLYQQFKNKVGFIGISTAFEDFEYNTIANTQLLLNQGITIGETKKYLSNQGVVTYSQVPKFPIAFDKMSSPKAFLVKEQLTTLTNLLTNHKTLSAEAEASWQQKIKHHYKKYPVIAESFTLNQLRGTPSFIIFKEDFTIIQSTFGHQQGEMLYQLLQNNLA